MSFALKSVSGSMLAGGERTSTAKPLMLVVFYGNPDYYIAMVREITAMARDFRIRLTVWNQQPPNYDWPAEIAVERVGRYSSGPVPGFLAQIGRLLEYVKFVRIIIRRVRELRPRIVYAYNTRAFVAGLAARRSVDFALVYHSHDLVDSARLSWLSPQHWIDKRALAKGKSASLVVDCDPARIERYVAQSHDLRPSFLLPMYPTLEQFPRPADFASLVERRFARREVLYTGGIGGEGNASISLIQAFALLSGDCRLTFYGPAPEEVIRQIHKLSSELALHERFRYGGQIPWLELMKRTTEAAVGVVTFRPINFNYAAIGSATNKLYEYAARGLPVVVPDTPSFRRALEAEKWVAFVNIDDPEAIVCGLRTFMSDRERYVEAAHAARHAFESRLNFECVFPQLRERLLSLAQMDGQF